jgi:hypothetical protein
MKTTKEGKRPTASLLMAALVVGRASGAADGASRPGRHRESTVMEIKTIGAASRKTARIKLFYLLKTFFRNYYQLGGKANGI